MKKIIIKILLIILFLEIFVFNFNSYRVFSNKNKQEFNSEDIEYVENNDGTTYIEIKDVNMEIKTVHINLKNVEQVNYKFLYTDETTKEYLSVPTKTYIQNLENSKYIPCYLSGNSKDIAIIIYEENVEIESIIINEKIPFNFNIVRMEILYIILLFIYGIKKCPIFQQEFTVKSLKQELILLLILSSFLIIIFYINNGANVYDSYDFYSRDFVKALSEGSLSLLEEPSEKLLELENPYSKTDRDAEGLIRDIDYIWDVALYNEKYYVYFGILPVILIMLPHYLITGKFLSSAYVVLIFSVLCAISIKALTKNIFIKYFPKVPFKFMTLSLLILLFGSQILILNGIPRFYEIPIISGLFFSITGVNFVLLANKIDKKSYRYMFIGASLLALSVVCRPTQLFNSLIVLPLIIKLLITNVKEKKNRFKLILSVGTPYVVVGIALMVYNYLRFENIFEFGASYQLTINDMSNLQNRFMTLATGIVCNLFSVPNIVLSFPFINNHNNLLTFYGYYYVENMIGGLFILVPICFYIFNIHKIYKNKETFYSVLILVIVGFLMCLCSIMIAGSMQRYMVDFAWILILASLMIFIEIYQKHKAIEMKNSMQKALGIISIYIVVINFCTGIVTEKSYMQYNSPEEFYKLKYTINFWE